MVIVTPLTLKGTRSMMMMQQLQPEMKKIQTRYKDDRQKLNEELLKFYKENDISPLGGCLPLLVQMPVFIVLYQVLRGLTRRASGIGFNFGWVSGQLGTGAPTSHAAGRSSGRSTRPTSTTARSCTSRPVAAPTPMQAVRHRPVRERQQGARARASCHAMPYLVLIAIVGVTGFVPAAADPGPQPERRRSTRSSR